MRRKPRKSRDGACDPDHQTLEHVFPRRMLQYEIRSFEWMRMNEVKACFSCNQRKGKMHPLNWLAVMPEVGIIRLVARLVDLGVPRRRIDKWLSKRNNGGQ